MALPSTLLLHMMRSIRNTAIVFILGFCCVIQAWGQQQIISFSTSPVTARIPEVTRSVQDNGLSNIQVNYQFPGAAINSKTARGIVFQILQIKGFSHLKSIGKPALPVLYDLILIPEDANPQLQISTSGATVFNDLMIYPALRPATDREGDPEPPFEMDEAFYQSNAVYPASPVEIIGTIKLRGMRIAIVQVCPLQYIPGQRKITAFNSLSYAINFKGASKFFGNIPQSNAFLAQLANVVLNGEAASVESKKGASNKNINGPSADYIIITHTNYLAAADSLAKWKSQMGYHCEVVSASSWTSAQVKSAIQQRYQNWNPKPEYFVILGDHDLIPGEIHQDPNYNDDFATDLYYACMDGAGDDVADMAFGRISVSSSAQAMLVVNKIINYEKTPPAIADFYTHGTVCALFQDDDSNSYEDRRFALTSEELHDYMIAQQGFTIDRVYDADTDVTPLFWNDDYYAAGEPIPAYLQKPGFPWDGDKYDIRDAINSASGRLFIAHRDHGYVGGSGWASPQFTTTDINMLNNGNRTPVVFSINCHTGEYQLPECFSEKFLRYPNGGAVGVFGAAYYSYSGYNDGLILGMFDAIWANPGILPNFTGYADSPIGTPTAHAPIYTMGDVLNQGILRMVQTWGDDTYTHELFHYFGDPAMKMWTEQPVAITATYSDTLHCNDTVFNIYSASLTNALATLVVDGELIAETQLISGVGSLSFAAFAGSQAVLTLSGHNFIPCIYNIPIDGDCVKADFDLSYNGLCVDESIDITNTSSGTILSYSWDFGIGATPATANTAGPHQIAYSTPGVKTITLTVSGSEGSNTSTQIVQIDQVCAYTMITHQVLSINACTGLLYDAGGNQNYYDNADDTVVITATGATSLQLMFNDFDVEPGSASTCDYDVLSIFDGPSTAAPLLGSWCNTASNIPPAGLTTSSNSFTVVFHSDSYTNMRGFELEWACVQNAAPPVAMFHASPRASCNGNIQCTDYSTNTPVSWLWDFGDGNTSTLQDPSHIYTQNGLFTITLTATNSNGSNTYTRLEYISINRPDAPVTDSAMICNSGSATVHATAGGSIEWYDAPYNGNLVGTGNSFTSPVLASTTTYYASSRIEAIHYVGPSDSALGSGAYYNGSTAHFLRFDALQDLTLKSVKVYAQTSANRKFRLRNSSGLLLSDTVVALTPGMHRVDLNFFVPAGSGYRLECDSICRLYRNATGANFPYTVADVISITGNSYTNQAYYYYFYDWEIQMNACNSPRAAATIFVHSSPPIALFSQTSNLSTYYFTDLSTDAASWSWDFDDGFTSPLQNPQHTYTANGSYHITLSVTNACGSNQFADTLDLYTVSTNNDFSELNLEIFPNPATNQLNIQWKKEIPGDVQIHMLDVTGRLIYSESPSPATKAVKLDIQFLSPGVYFIEFLLGKNSKQFKLVKY